MDRQLFVHIGVSKSGTSSFQAGAEASQQALAEAGVGVPLAARAAKAKQLLRPLGWRTGEGYCSAVDDAALDAAVGKIRRTPGDRLLLTCEDLAELDEERLRAFMDRVQSTTRLQVHVIVTARDWSRQLPSEWQQQLKRRMTTDYATYLAQVRDHEGADADQFRARQDVSRMCTLWLKHVPADRIHVIPVTSADRDGIFREISTIVDYPQELLQPPERQINQSFGYVECEVLRRLNLELGDRLPSIGTQYTPGVRPLLRGDVLARGGGIRLSLPREHLEWVQEEGRRQVGELKNLGVDARGDLDLLVSSGDNIGELPEIDEADIARVAMATLANLAVKASQARGRRAGRE